MCTLGWLRYLILFVVLGGEVRSDMPPMPHAKAFTSSNGQFIFMVVPGEGTTGGSGDGVGRGTMYAVTSEGGIRELWKTDGWFSPRIAVSWNGQYIVRIEDEYIGNAPRSDSPALSFYRGNSLLKSYYIGDLVHNFSKIKNKLGRYAWVTHIDIRDVTMEVVTCDDKIYNFDFRTGDLFRN